ncbi:MAG: D-2-hydroxyacid dehydrogenase, partial [Leuconostoc gelidum]
FYLSPHIAFYTNTAIKNMVEIALDDAVIMANGGHTENEILR